MALYGMKVAGTAQILGATRSVDFTCEARPNVACRGVRYKDFGWTCCTAKKAPHRWTEEGHGELHFCGRHHPPMVHIRATKQGQRTQERWAQENAVLKRNMARERLRDELYAAYCAGHIKFKAKSGHIKFKAKSGALEVAEAEWKRLE